MSKHFVAFSDYWRLNTNDVTGLEADAETGLFRVSIRDQEDERFTYYVDRATAEIIIREMPLKDVKEVSK